MADFSDLGFDANKEEPNAGFDLLPAGEYDVVIVNSEVKPTSTGGKLLKLEMQVINGNFQNRKLWDNLNLWNSSQEAVKIARGTLSAICRAVNVLTPRDSNELHNKPLRVSVKIKKGDANYGDKNVISAYKSRAFTPNAASGAPVTSPAGGPTQPTGQPAATANPWG
jgi:hypothetical protein